MDKIFTVAKVVAPIFISIFLGMYAKRKKLLTQEGIAGMQQFVMNFGLPCVVFNSLLKAELGAEALTSMGLVLPLMLLGTFWAFRARKNKFPYQNFPQLFAAQETGMLGIPLFMILFGADQAYRMGVLDLAQAPAAFPVIALLSAKATESTNPAAVQTGPAVRGDEATMERHRELIGDNELLRTIYDKISENIWRIRETSKR